MPTQKEQAIARVVAQLGSKKDDFRYDLQASIRTLISSQTRGDCVGIIERSVSTNKLIAYGFRIAWNSELAEGDRRYEIVPVRGFYQVQKRYSWKQLPTWTDRFITMCRYKGDGLPTIEAPLHDKILDSCLTAPIIGKIQQAWVKLFQNNQELTANGMIDIMAHDPVITKQLAYQLAAAVNNSADPMTEHAHKALIHFVTTEVSTHMSSATAGTIGSHVSTAVTHAAGGAIIKTLLTAIAQHMHALIAKKVALFVGKSLAGIIATAAVQKPIVKLVATTVVAAIAHAVGISSIGTAVAAVVLPLIVLWTAIEVANFPSDLADELAPKIANTVVGNFDSTNEKIINEMFKTVITDNIKSIAWSVVKESDMADQLKEVATEHISICKSKGLDWGRDVELPVKKEKDTCSIM